MSDRRAELERKRQRLASIREQKERRKREFEGKTEDLKPEKKEPIKLETTEEILSSLNISLTSDISLNHSPSSLNSLGVIEETTSSLPDNSIPSVPSTVSLKNLSICHGQQVNILPKEYISYNKETQTQVPQQDREAHPLDYYVLTYAESEDGEGHSLEFPNAIKPPGLPRVEVVQPPHSPEPSTPIVPESKSEKPLKPRGFTEEEKSHLMLQENFQQFFHRTTRIIERALFESPDVTSDYLGYTIDEEGEDKCQVNLDLSRHFYNENLTKNRTVTSFDWSTQFPELLVASYTHNEDAINDTEGLCLVWNMKFKKDSPEFIFHSQSQVMCASFAKFHPNILIGGTYSGQIVLWDNRCFKKTPVQRSTLSATSHTHPVYCLQVVGAQNAHNLVSVSTDGKMCTWNLEMISSPIEVMELNNHKQSCVAVTSLSFPTADFNNFIVGSEEDCVYSGCRHGTKAGIADAFEGHQGPITGVDSHRAQGPKDFSHLFLSSSADWTVKLWNLKDPKPIYSFEQNGDYVFDTRWSPIHPALFACIDGTGKLDIWNLNNDTELPTASKIITGNPALNKLTWTPQGNQIAIGDDGGKIWILDVAEQLAVPRPDDWTKFGRVLSGLVSNKMDKEEETFSYSHR